MILDALKHFNSEIIDDEQFQMITNLAKKDRQDVLMMINSAGSGHPGGALSSIDIYLMLYLTANISSTDIDNPARDRIVVSHGHTSAGIYAALGNFGFFNIQEAINGFRKVGNIFEGHPSIKVPGIEWCSGSLGQGLSVGCGFALASQLKKQNNHVFVIMGDGEQAKGQLQEAREFAIKYRLTNLTAIIDCNGLQASGKIDEVMVQNIAGKYKAAGWRVIQANGHDYRQLYQVLRDAYFNQAAPCVIIAKTVMGKGVSFIEDHYEYHGRILSAQQYEMALAELSTGITVELWNNSNSNRLPMNSLKAQPVEDKVKYGSPILYSKDKMVDCRSAFGEALYDIARINAVNTEVHIAALDCDLAESVKLQRFGGQFPQNLIECGIQEHNTATIAGALSKSGILTFFADFGVFGIDETYGQHRISDLNHTSLKLICTHNGLDVGEDGKTHQCIDYIALMTSLFGFKTIVPGDANQTDRIIRYIATTPGNFAIMMGRSKLPILTLEDGSLFYGEKYCFHYGEADWIRNGTEGTIVTCGNMVFRAIIVRQKLLQKGINVGVLNLTCPTMMDEPKLIQAAKAGLIVTYEDHNIRNGIGSIVGTFLSEKGLGCMFKKVGITQYGISGNPDSQYLSQGMDVDSVVNLIEKTLTKGT